MEHGAGSLKENTETLKMHHAKRKLKAADLFCGAGGTSTGLVEACAELGYQVELTAINHWDVAVATHTENHPGARHLCASLDALNPRDLYAEGELDVLWASPECTHHSVARGGKPISDQSRATAWCVVRWAEALRPTIILIENVKEFETWGPIGVNGRPMKSRRGETFHAWVNCLRSLGYRVECRRLVAADYGDPTTRERLFIYAVRGRRKIVWPEPTHAEKPSTDFFSQRKPWVPAKEIIDWSLPGKSIFKRKKPLAEKTLNRIMVGLEKFGMKPFIMGAGGPARAGEPISIERPMRTVLTKNNSHVAEPFLVHLRGTGTANDIEKPTPAVTAGGMHLGLCEPYLVQCNHGNGTDPNGDHRRVRNTDKPLPTVAGNRGEWALCEPFLMSAGGPNVDPRPVSKPANTVLTRDHMALVEPMLIGQQSGGVARAVSQPAPTIATSGAVALVEPYLIAIDHQSSGNGTQETSRPLGTQTTKARHAVCEPYLTKFYGTGGAVGVDQPLDAVTTKERFGLVQPVVEIEGERYLLDIRFRMLKPHELAAAQGFPKGYKFVGNSTQVVKQIGNAVPKNLAKALVRAALTQEGVEV